MTSSNQGKMSDVMSAASPAGLRVAMAKSTPDRWAQFINLQVDGHPFTFEGRPFLRGIIRDHFPQRAIRKSAQMGATVISLTTALFWWRELNWNVMYLLPVKAGTIAFSQGRIQPMIDSSQYIASVLEAVDNINHKRTGKANFYVRGTNIPTELQEVPVDAMIWDERDKMREKNMGLAMTRMDASNWKWVMQLSTPTVPNFGIDRAFQESDQRYWFMDCPKCGYTQTLTWDDNVMLGNSYRDTKIGCQRCRKSWQHKDIIEASERNGRWEVTESKFSDEMHGYQINQLFSPTRPIIELARIYFRGLEEPDLMRELYNSALGLPYVMEGDRLTEEILDACCEGGPRKLLGSQHVYRGEQMSIGIDVGAVMHVQASVLNKMTGRKEKVIAETMSWEQLHLFLDAIDGDNDWVAVIDNFPETKKAQELAHRFWGRVFCCQYVNNAELAEWKYPPDRSNWGRVKADRTLALDYVNNQYIRKAILLPVNMREVGDHQNNRPYNGWYRQMMSQVRIQQPDTRGNMIARHEKVDGPDHWHHAAVYEMLAGMFATPGAPPVAEQQQEVLTMDDLDMADYGVDFEGLSLDGFNIDGLSID